MDIAVKITRSFLSFLLIAKNKVNPFANILAHCQLLKGFPHFGDIEIGVISGPARQFHIMHPLLVLHDPQIKLVDVEIGLGEGIHFGD